LKPGNKALEDLFNKLSALSQKNKNAFPPDPIEKCLCEGKEGGLYLHRAPGLVTTFRLCPVCNPFLHCPKCKGTGRVVTLDTHITSERIESHERWIPHLCECKNLETALQRLNLSGIPERYKSLEAWDSIPPLLAQEETDLFKIILGQVGDFLNQTEGKLGFNKPFLILTGPVGTGKTHLAVKALQHLVLNKGLGGKFIEFQTLLYELKATYASKGSEREILQPIMDAPFLVVDELGKGQPEKQWIAEKLDEIIATRYNQNRITLFTTNYPIMNAKHRSQPTPSRSVSPGEMVSIEVVASKNKSEPDPSPWKGDSFVHRMRNSFDVSLLEKVGPRIFDRLIESSVIVSLNGLPSLRQISALAHFQKIYGAPAG
jgi:DNA replication protein DnaC